MIRWGSAADAEAIAEVMVESWSSVYRGLMPDSVVDGVTIELRTAQWHQIFADPYPRTAVFVAEHDGAVVGMSHVGATRDGDLDVERIGEVFAIYVVPEHAGHGHGKGLMMKSLDWMRSDGFSAAMLWVLDTNTVGRGFYERGGWRLDTATKMDESFGEPLNEVRYRIGLPAQA